MKIFRQNGHSIALIDKSYEIQTSQDLLDLFVTANYNSGCSDIIVHKESLSDDFFDLKTRIAGELLQKCSNYRIRFAVVGDFSEITSRSLRDFIYECNKGNLVFFKSSIDEALAALT